MVGGLLETRVFFVFIIDVSYISPHERWVFAEYHSITSMHARIIVSQIVDTARMPTSESRNFYVTNS